jgi:hypothetical protein
MRKSLGWTVAILGLVTIGASIACSAKYSAQNNGLIVVPSRADQVVQTFSLNLSNGSATQINNPGFPVINGFLASIILNPVGSFAYMIVNQNPASSGSATGIAASQIASDGKVAGPTLVSLNNTAPSVTGPCNQTVQVTPTPVVPQALAIDSAGKYLFVADSVTSGQIQQPYSCNGTTVTTVAVPGTVSVFSVNGTSLTEVAGSPFALPVVQGTQAASASALAVTPTIYPNEYAVCAQQTASTTENLYVTDSVNYVVVNYSVNTSTGVLTIVPTAATEGVPTGTVPSGVAVDPCNRFAFVANASGAQGNSVSAYTICSAVSVSLDCPAADFSLHPVPNSPFATGLAPGPLSVDAYGNFLYVVATGSSYINAFRISSATGALSPLTPATYALTTALGQDSGANSIVIRSDDSFLFVANSNAETLSEFGVVPETGGLSPVSPVSTFNYPSGVAVK